MLEYDLCVSGAVLMNERGWGGCCEKVSRKRECRAEVLAFVYFGGVAVGNGDGRVDRRQGSGSAVVGL